MKRIALVGGGARSGKSAFALALARSRGARRVFVATGQAFDDEMRARIAAHARERGPDFVTIEEPVAVPARLDQLDAAQADVVVIDCLTLWLSNLMLRDEPEAAIAHHVDALADALRRCACHTIVVTNEVGLGLVPETPLGRAFRDVTGRAHQTLAAIADDLYLAVMGVVLQLRPAPVSLALVPPPSIEG